MYEKDLEKSQNNHFDSTQIDSTGGPQKQFDSFGSNEDEDDGGLINQTGDNMVDFMWDGPENSDEEIEEMAVLKNKYEKERGIVFSKNGIISFIENLVEQEKNDKKWQQKLKAPNIQFYLKDGGSHIK